MATTNLGLDLQNQADPNWHTKNNSNFQKIDDFLTLKRCRVYATGVQVITTATMTPIYFAEESYDTDNMHVKTPEPDNSRITITTAGLYIIKGQLAWDVAAGGRRITFLYRNGAEIARVEGQAVADATAVPTQFLSTDYVCSASDFIQLYGYHTKGTDQNTKVAGVITSYLMVVRVGF